MTAVQEVAVQAEAGGGGGACEGGRRRGVAWLVREESDVGTGGRAVWVLVA